MYKILRSFFYLALIAFMFSGCASPEKARTLYKEGERQQALEMAKTFLNDEDENVRFEAVKLIGEIGGKDGSEMLVEALDDSSPTVKNAAIRQMGLLRYFPASGKLIDMSFEAKGQTLEEIGGAIRRIGKPAMDMLAKKYASTSDPGTLKQYKEVILEVGKDMTPSITKNMAGKSSFQNRTTFEILMDFKSPEVAKHMLKEIDNPETADMVVKGLSKLGRMAFRPVLSKLERLMRRPGMVDVKERLIEVLKNLKDRRSIETLEKLTMDENNRIRRAANSALIHVRNF